MRRILELSVVCLAVGAAGACNPEEIIETEHVPVAGVRFIHAVPDTGAMDFRFVDLPENSAHWSIAFRNNPVFSGGITASTLVQYKPARVGQRHLRIFLNSTTPSVASTVVKDTVVTLEEGKNYTALLWGDARGGANAMRFLFFEENVPDPGNQVALRVINASGSAIDASYYPATGTPPGTPIASNLAPLTRSNYVLTAPGRYRYNVRSAGVASPSIADGLALTGAAAVDTAPGPFDALPGTTVAGSAVTMIVFPISVSGSQAPAFPITTGRSAAVSATASGYARQSGSFASDGFFVGEEITASGYVNSANNGTSIVTAIGEPATTGATSLSATTTGYARAAGSFVTNGFRVGQTITASGFTNAENNGRALITAVTAGALTVTKTGGTVAEAAAANRTITGDATLTVSKTGGTALEAGTTGPIRMSATVTGYVRTTGSFVDDGFVVGQNINASGFTDPANNGPSVITTVTPASLTVTKTGGTVAEAAGDGRTIANAELRQLTGIVGRVWSFIWDRRPPRPAGI